MKSLRENKNCNFCALLPLIFYKKFFVFFVLRAKVKTIKKMKKVSFFHFLHKAWGYYETPCIPLELKPQLNQSDKSEKGIQVPENSKGGSFPLLLFLKGL